MKKKQLLDYLNGTNPYFLKQSYILNSIYEGIDECVFTQDCEALEKILDGFKYMLINPLNPISFSEVICKYFKYNRAKPEIEFKYDQKILNIFYEYFAKNNITLSWGLKEDGFIFIKPGALITDEPKNELEPVTSSNNFLSDEQNDLAVIGYHPSNQTEL